MRLNNADVMATISIRSAVNNDCGEIVHSIGIHSVVGLETIEKFTLNIPQMHRIMQSSHRIEEPQLQWKNDPMRHLNVPIILFHVLKSLQMQSEYHRQLFDAHSLLSLLIGAAIITFKLIITTQRFGVAEAFQAMRYRCVLINVHLQIEKVLVFAADGLAVETTRLAGEHALEDLVHPCWLVGRR